MDFSQRPLLVYWELTRACDLACRHCRAEAVPWRHPGELSTAEGYALLGRLAGFGQPLPHLVLTGGDPLKRPDLYDLIAYARRLGFTVSITPSGTTSFTREVVNALKEAGIWILALSIDGSTPQRHDALRGVEGSFAQTMQACLRAREVGLPLQINTLVCAETLEDLPALYGLVGSLGVVQWSLFFLIPIGRGRVLREVEPRHAEGVMHWVYDLAQTAPFRIKTTEAPHYRRVALQRMAQEKRNGRSARGIGQVERGFGVRDGSGVMFISHVGEIYPAGFLPLAAGHVRRDDPVVVYRDSPLFRALRDPNRLRGKCGRCPYRKVCGGSRARAFAVLGDPLESDPLCPYEPALDPAPVLEGVA
ncbi:Putative mycofactocin radical SAM maturase MftC [bacterium HR23]|nr:Putative mycofactocin radical SAM maturase MftC [bacterium HR23]